MPPRPALNDHNLFFFDCETGGLESPTADMIEVACVLTDPSGKNVLEEYCAKVIPRMPVQPDAARINGYTAEKWASGGAIDVDVAVTKLVSMSRHAIFVAHNTPFDWAFFGHALARKQARWDGSYHKIDTVALALPLLRFGRVPNLKLETLVPYFGYQQEEAHEALSDARDCRKVFLALMERYAAAFGATGAA